jgi:CRP-like cAMP-binding protein
MGWSGARRAGITAVVVIFVTAGLAVLVSVLSNQAWPPVVVSALGAVPGLYLAWKAVPGAANRPMHDRRARAWDPVELGVHQVIEGGSMPPYVCRAHDRLLAAVLDPAVAASRLVVVRGGSSTGKTRAAFEAVTSVLAQWRLYYPLDAAALEARLDAGLRARTVLWLGDLRQYTSGDDSGASVLGRLADFLESQDHLVVVTTTWPEHWDSYVEPVRSGPAQQPGGTVGRLLARLPDLTGLDPAGIVPSRGGVISIPDVFSIAELEAAAVTGDRVLAQAVQAAAQAGQAGQLAQYLAGVPDLLHRYSGLGGDPYGQAVIIAAMDATRLGHVGPLPAALLIDAAVGYLNDTQRCKDKSSWGDLALDWASRPLRGTVRALAPVPPPRGTGTIGYRLADYLDQYGRRTRQQKAGPAALWDALAAYGATDDDLARLGRAAQTKGLFRYATALWRWPPSSFLGSLDDATRERLLRLGTTSEYPAGQPLTEQGDSSQHVIALLDGWVKQTVVTGHGREALLAVQGGGDLVGEESLFDNHPRPSTMTTLGVVTGCVIGQAAFLTALRDDQSLTPALCQSILRKLRSADKRRADFGSLDVVTRLARILQDLAARLGDSPAEEVEFPWPLARSDLASMIGASQAATERAMRQLREQGVIATGYRSLTIFDMGELKRLADG